MYYLKHTLMAENQIYRDIPVWLMRHHGSHLVELIVFSISLEISVLDFNIYSQAPHLIFMHSSPQKTDGSGIISNLYSYLKYHCKYQKQHVVSWMKRSPQSLFAKVIYSFVLTLMLLSISDFSYQLETITKQEFSGLVEERL